MEAKKLDFSKEAVRIMDALEELENALENLGEAMVEKGVLNEKLYITSGVLDCGITDGNLWYRVDNIESLTDGYGIKSVAESANFFFDDGSES